VFGLGQKGRIEIGADADLAIVDLNAQLEIRDEIVLSKIGWTPYAGLTIYGLIDRTLVRGRTVYGHGRVTGEPGWGRQASPSPRIAVAAAPTAV
jgi:dihydroorotase